MKKLAVILFSAFVVLMLYGCGSEVSQVATPTSSPISVDEVILTFNTFEVDQLVLDIPQYENKDIILKSTVKPSSSSSFLTVNSSDNTVAEIVTAGENTYRLILKDAGKVAVTATCGEISKTINITVTDLPKQEKAVLLTSNTTTADTNTATLYYYDDKNLCTSRQFSNTASDGKTQTGTVTLTYNDKDMLIDEKSSTGESSHYEYDEQGNMTLNQISSSGGIGKIFMEYDDNGHKIKEKVYINSTFTIDTTYSYDENGILIREDEVMMPNDFSVPSVSVYTYDKDGNITNITRTSTMTFESLNLTTESLTTTDRFYDENGWFVREEVLADYNDSPSVVEYQYDVYGNVVTQTTTNPNASDDESPYTKIEYEYDNYGNCITEKTYYNKSATEPDTVTTNTWKIVTSQ